MTTHVDTSKAGRIATIYRAIQFMERYGPASDMVFMTLQYTQVHQHLKEDPHELIRLLHKAIEDGHLFGSWKVAQQICQSAGLEY